MNELIDRKYISLKGEILGNITTGIQNKLFTGGNKGTIDVGYRNFEHTNDLERYEILKELEDQEKYLKTDLESGSDEYKSRLCLNSIHDTLELDLGSSNIIDTQKTWNNSLETKFYARQGDFSLCDIYIKITSENDFNKEDLLSFINVSFSLEIGGNYVNNRNFFSTVFFELLDDQDIFIESNIIYLKVFTFQNMLYGLPTKVLRYHQVGLDIIGLDKDIHKKYTIKPIIINY